MAAITKKFKFAAAASGLRNAGNSVSHECELSGLVPMTNKCLPRHQIASSRGCGAIEDSVSICCQCAGLAIEPTFSVERA